MILDICNRSNNGFDYIVHQFGQYETGQYDATVSNTAD